MEVNNPTTVDYIKDANGIILKPKRLAIGAWNMDIEDFVYVVHGLSWLSIRSVSGLIYNDAVTETYPLSLPSTNGGLTPEVGILWNGITVTHIIVTRKLNGLFDGINYNDGVMNRGYLLVWFEV